MFMYSVPQKLKVLILSWKNTRQFPSFDLIKDFQYLGQLKGAIHRFQLFIAIELSFRIDTSHYALKCLLDS